MPTRQDSSGPTEKVGAVSGTGVAGGGAAAMDLTSGGSQASPRGTSSPRQSSAWVRPSERLSRVPNANLDRDAVAQLREADQGDATVEALLERMHGTRAPRLRGHLQEAEHAMFVRPSELTDQVQLELGERQDLPTPQQRE